MHELATEEDRPSDGAAAAGCLLARADVGVSATKCDMPKARARSHRGSSDESEMARVVRQVWLSIATGGWWSLNDVRDARPSLSKHDVAARLSLMAKKGFVVSREMPPERRAVRPGVCGRRPRFEYCVTPECRVPSGLTAGEVSRALTGA